MPVVRILHLSDLHLSGETAVTAMVDGLVRGLRHKLGDKRIHCLVLSGDLTNTAAPAEFDRALEFVNRIRAAFGIATGGCLVVPGNHDSKWTEHTHRERFASFRNFFERAELGSYPSDQDCEAVIVRLRKALHMLGLNSAWDITQSHPHDASINASALSYGLSLLGGEQLAAKGAPLRIVVCHHPLIGRSGIEDAACGHLRQAGFTLCLHGHLHDQVAEIVQPYRPERSIHVIGAGSVAAPASARPESAARLCHVIQISRDGLRNALRFVLGLRHRVIRIRVDTLRSQTQGGAWEGDARWPDEDPGDDRSRYRTFYEFKIHLDRGWGRLRRSVAPAALALAIVAPAVWHRDSSAPRPVIADLGVVVAPLPSYGPELGERELKCMRQETGGSASALSIPGGTHVTALWVRLRGYDGRACASISYTWGDGEPRLRCGADERGTIYLPLPDHIVSRSGLFRVDVYRDGWFHTKLPALAGRTSEACLLQQEARP